MERYSKQDARFGGNHALEKYDAYDQREDLGLHRLEGLPLAGDRRNRGGRGRQGPSEPEAKPSPQGPSRRTGERKVDSRWTGVYEENLDMTRDDGIGEGNLHRMGDNYNPKFRRSNSLGPSPRRPGGGLHHNRSGLGRQGGPEAFMGPYPVNPGPPARAVPLPAVAPPVVNRPQRCWNGQLATAADFQAGFASIFGGGNKAPAASGLLQSRHAPAQETQSPLRPAQTKPAAAVVPPAKAPAVAPVPSAKAPTAAPPKQQNIEPVNARPAPTNTTVEKDLASGKVITIYAGDLVTGFIDSVVQASYPQFAKIEGLEELLKKFREVILQPDLLSSLSDSPKKETAGKPWEVAPAVYNAKEEAVRMGEKSKADARTAIEDSGCVEKPKVQLAAKETDAWGMNISPKKDLQKPSVVEQPPTALTETAPSSTIQSKHASGPEKPKPLPPHLGQKPPVITNKPTTQMLAVEKGVATKGEEEPKGAKMEKAGGQKLGVTAGARVFQFQPKPVPTPKQDDASSVGSNKTVVPINMSKQAEKEKEGSIRGHAKQNEEEDRVTSTAIAELGRVTQKTKDIPGEIAGPEKAIQQVAPKVVAPPKQQLRLDRITPSQMVDKIEGLFKHKTSAETVPQKPKENYPQAVADKVLQTEKPQSLKENLPQEAPKEPIVFKPLPQGIANEANVVKPIPQAAIKPSNMVKPSLQFHPQPQPRPNARGHSPPKFSAPAKALPPPIAPPVPDAMLRAKRLAKSESISWKLCVKLDVTSLVPSCTPYEVEINCLDNPIATLLLSLRKKLSYVDYDAVCQSDEFKDYSARVSKVFNQKMTKLWGEGFTG